jgi:hypothetical protein
MPVHAWRAGRSGPLRPGGSPLRAAPAGLICSGSGHCGWRMCPPASKYSRGGRGRQTHGPGGAHRQRPPLSLFFYSRQRQRQRQRRVTHRDRRGAAGQAGCLAPVAATARPVHATTRRAGVPSSSAAARGPPLLAQGAGSRVPGSAHADGERRGAERAATATQLLGSPPPSCASATASHFVGCRCVCVPARRVGAMMATN